MLLKRSERDNSKGDTTRVSIKLVKQLISPQRSVLPLFIIICFKVTINHSIRNTVLSGTRFAVRIRNVYARFFHT